MRRHGVTRWRGTERVSWSRREDLLLDSAVLSDGNINPFVCHGGGVNDASKKLLCFGLLTGLDRGSPIQYRRVVRLGINGCKKRIDNAFTKRSSRTHSQKHTIDRLSCVLLRVWTTNGRPMKTSGGGDTWTWREYATIQYLNEVKITLVLHNKHLHNSAVGGTTL